jgi:alkylated DNA repair dioxygenase AlkB
MSITCALSDDQIAKLFKLTYKRMKDALDSGTEFDADAFMKDLFNKISSKEDTDTAAKFVQQIPAIVSNLSNKKALLNLDFVGALDEKSLRKLNAQFKSDEGIKAVIDKYSVKPDPVPNKIENEANEANKLQLNQIPIPEEPVTVIESNRFKTLSPWGGTLQNYIKINPNKKSDGSIVIEEINPEKAAIIKTFENIKQIQAMSDTTDGVIYEGKKLMFRAENLDLFARGKNLDMLDKETRTEIAASRTIRDNIKTGKTKKENVNPNIAQVDQRVILILTDEFGSNIYVDNEGKLTDSEKGKLVYQFMRTVRKDGSKYTVKDIYNKEDQVLSPEEFAKMTYNPEIDGTKREYFDLVVAEQQKQMKELYDLQQKALKNEAELLPVTGITTGVPSNLSSTNILLNELTKFPGITTDVYRTIRTAPRATATLRKGEASIIINGSKFALDRPRITKDVADEVASVLTNANIPLAAKKVFVDQFLPASLDTEGTTKKYKFNFDKDLKYLYFNEYKDFKFKNPVNEKGDLLTDTNLKKLSAEQIKSIKERIVNVLMNGGYRNNKEGQTNAVFMSYDSDKLGKTYQRLSEDGTRFIDKSYTEFLSTLPIEVKIINADPGFYNYSVSYTTPESTLGQIIKKGDSPSIERRSDIDLSDAASIQRELSLSRNDDNRLDAAGSLAERLAQKREDEYYDRIAYAKDHNPSPKSKKEEIVQILTEPEAPAPESTNSAVSEIFKSNGKIDLNSIPGSFDRKGYSKDFINPVKILQAKKWWNSKELKPLRDLISLEHVANIVNSDVFATFIVNGAVLADTNEKMGSIKVNKANGSFYQNLTAYHEAWHVFSQLFLTKEQKIELYTELQNYTDAKGNQPHANKSFRQLEEMLAEDFRNYVKTGKAKQNAPKRNTIFRRILNFLKQLFGKYLNKFKKQNIQIDSMNSPMAKELFDNLYLGRFNSYQASIDNALLYELDRGARQVVNTKEDALSPQDSSQMVNTIDGIWAEIIDDIYDTRVVETRKQIAEEGLKAGDKVTPEYIEKKLHTKGLKSASVLMLTEPAKRTWLYGETKNRLQEILKQEKDKLEKVEGQKDFNTYTTLKEISDNAVAVMKNKKGEDKYFFLASQVDDFSKLNPSLKRGERVRGEDYKDSIKILGDFYKHKEITKDERPVDIVIISKLEDAPLQFENYKVGKADVYTELIQNKDAKNILVDEKQQLVRDNIRILQNTIANWGDEKHGIIKYHMENTDYEIGKDKFDIEVQNQSKQEIDQDGDVVDETESDTGAFEPKTGTLSLQQMMSKETNYLIKSLFKVNPDGTTPTDRFGIKERADFAKVFTILAKTIGGERDRYKAYEKLGQEAEKFPELKQLYEKKYPDPSNIKNTHEIDVSLRFWQDFGKFRVKYMQLFAFNDADSRTIDFRVKESSIAIDNTLNRWMALFKSTQANSYINKSKDNVSTLNLANLVKDFSTKGELAEKDALDFARAMAIDLDNNDNIKKELVANFDYYGLPYIFDIVKGFNEINNLKEGDPALTADKVKYLDMFKKNPIDVLKNIVPVGVLSNLKGSVKELTQLKRLAELQSKYGFDSATTGVIRANGNTGYQEMNWSSAASYVYALNEVDEMNQLWTDPRFSYMSYLNPAINPHTLQLNIIKSLFGADGKKIEGKSVLLMAVDGTSMSNKKTIKKNGRDVEVEEAEGNTTTELDPQSKFLQELHTMLLGGVAEFPRHSEKKFSYGIKVIGGVEGSSVGFYKKGDDKNLYVDMDKFMTTDSKGRSEGEIYAIGNNFFPYIQGEFDRIKKFRGANKEEYLKVTGYNKLVNDGNGNDVPAGSIFSAFDSVLRQETKDELYKLADEQVDVPLIDYLRGKPLRKMITDDIIDYFNEKTGEIDNLYFQKMPFLSKSIFEKLGYKAESLDNNTLNNLKKDKTLTEKILKAYLYNDFIHKYETSMLVYGDHAQWGHDKEDWTKRIPGSTSDGVGFNFDEGISDFINTNYNNVTYASLNMPEISEENKFMYGETLNTAVIKDAVRDSLYLDDMVKAWKKEYAGTYDSKTIDELIKKDIKPFMGMKEGDGMAYMTFDAYRTLHKTGRGWTLAQENLYQRIIKGEKISPKTVKDYFPVYKLHYFGALENNLLPVRAMHKFAVIPLIPGVNAQEGSELDTLHKKMLRENIQYVAFDSCSKGANLTTNGKIDNIFANKDEKAIKEDTAFTVNPIYMANLKEVTVINEHFKGSLPIATQTRGILLDNLYSEGGLINEKNKPVLDEYLSAVKDYSEILKEELLSEIGFELVDGRYIGNLTQFIEVIRDELKNRDTPDHLIRLLNTDNDNQLAMDLSLHPEADTVEKLIMSFLQNGLIKQKTNGEPLVQTPSTFTNGIWDSQYSTLTNPKEIKEWLGTNTLPFYGYNENGRSTEMKVAVALQGEFVKLLNGKHTDGEKISTIDRLNEVIKDPKWLKDNKDAVTMFGPRIPNDATNTIEAATVWHFLPEAFGNSIIVPTEIVAKAGSDFDGDKLFMTFPNLDRDGKVISKGVDKFESLLKETQALEKANKSIKGRPSSRALLAEQKKYLQNRFKNAAVEILMLPENYAYLTKPNGTYLVDKYVPELEENKKGYNRYTNTHGQAPKLSAADENGKRKTVISPTRVLEATYNLYKHDANLSLEASLGIMAKLTKSHPIYKSVGAKMPATYKASSFIEALNKTVETGYELPVVMRFTHNKIKNAKGKEVISLSGERTQRGSRISDVSSHALQGILDRAKESFPFELKLVPEAMDVFSYMLQAGVDEEQIFFFLNQPLIAEYFEKQKLKESAYSKIVGGQEKGGVANNIINKVLKNFSKDSLDIIYDRINVAKLRYVLNDLKAKGEDTKYYYKVKKVSGVTETTLEDLIKKLNNGGLAAQNIERISWDPSLNQDSTVYSYSTLINSVENFAFTTEVLSKEFLPKGDVSTTTLKDGVKDDKTMKALTLFMNYLELERQFKGMNDLQQTFSPDTGKLTTVQQVIKRMEAYDALRKSKSIDQEFLEKLINKSVLSSFNQDQLIKDLTEPLFNLRLNPEITKYISDAFVDQSKASQIRNNPTFGKGINGQERFSTLFNNGVINFILQNYTSNFANEKGELVNIPDTYTDNRPVLIVDDLDTDAGVFEEGIAINTLRIETDYANKAYLESSTSENNYGARGLDTFKLKDDPFQTLASYYRYVIARESIRVNNPIESLEDNSDFLKRVVNMGNASDAYESYISERALAGSYNNKYIMGKTKYSYSDSLLNLINEFGDTLKINYPITAQLTPGTNTDGAKVLTLNNQKEAQGELASVYYNNLRNLSDPSITKVQNKNKTAEENASDNKRISEMFDLFSLAMFYQNGIGKTRLGFVKALDPIKYKNIISNASKAFTANYLNKETLDSIFNTVVSMDKFKNYLVSPKGYIHTELATLEASKPANDGTLETFDDDEGEDQVLVRLINQEDVDLFNAYVKKSGGKRPERFFTSKTLFPAFYNTSTGKRSGMPQSAIWIKNKYDNYDMIDQESGEVYYENANLSTGMYVAPKVEGEQKSTGPVSQSNKPKGQQVKEGIYVNQGALTKEEQLELFNYLKPYLEEQANKSLKSSEGSKMIGLGLRWDYTNNNPGRASVNIPDPIKRNPKYGYYNQSVNGQSLGQITPRFRELMQKATGVDMTNYDGAIINLYEKDTFISSHNDVDESKSAIKYPVIGINIGGKGNFSIERLGPENAMLNLEAGSGYIFGVDGINREVWHRTFPTPQDSFLPELTTKIDGKTYPEGSYRITITMRRVMPLTAGMPQAPSIVTETTTPTPAPTGVASGYTNYSGAATGGDTVWAEVGKEYGLGKQVDYTPQTLQKLSQDQVQEVETAYQKAVKDLGRNPLPYDWNDPNKKVDGKSIYYNGGLVRRDYLQAKAADAVFAIGNVLTPGDKNKKGYAVKSKTDSVDGGTGYAVQMAINLGKPVYVFDQTYEKWFAWEDGKFRISDVPTLTTKFAGIGTREINEAGKQAIRDVYENTFKAPSQPSTQPAIVKIEPTDKIIWGHPTIGKSFLKKNQDNRFISLDDDYASEINTKVKEIADKYNVTTYQVKDGGDQQWNTEYNKMMQNLFDKVKAVALSENKILFTSNTNLLKNNADVFDKVINLTNEEFQKRISERGAKYDTVTWKKQIEDAVSKIPSNKVIVTDRYLSDLLPSTQPTKAPVSPAPIDSIEYDMKVYAWLVHEMSGVQPKDFSSGTEGIRMYKLNKFGNYDLVDRTTGEIYVRNINMETGKQETEPGLDSPVDPEVIAKALDRLITLRATTNIEEQLATKGYDINDIINNLAEAKTQEDYNKITKILDKLC